MINISKVIKSAPRHPVPKRALNNPTTPIKPNSKPKMYVSSIVRPIAFPITSNMTKIITNINTPPSVARNALGKDECLLSILEANHTAISARKKSIIISTIVS